MYNSLCANIVDVKDPYNRVILYAFTNLFIDIVQVKTGQIPDGGIRTILIQAIRSFSTVAEMQAMEAARAKQQAIAEMGARVQKEKSNKVLHWVASAAQFLLDAFPFLDDGGIAAVLSSREKRAERAKLLPEPARKLLLEPPVRLGKYRTIRDKISQARALGLIVSRPRSTMPSEEAAP